MMRSQSSSSLQIVVGLLLIAGSVVVWGCGSDRADPPAEGTGGGGHEGGAGYDIQLPPPTKTGRCTTGAVQECTEYFEVGGIQSCFVGLQLCVEREWGICSDQQTIDELIEELGYDEEPSGGGGASGHGGAGGASG